MQPQPTDVTIIARRYVLRDKIGAGGMGTVFRATDRLTRQMVGLKRLSTALTPSSGAPRGSEPSDQVTQTAVTGFAPGAPTSTPSSITLRLALTQEFKVLASLRHPHIISVLDYGFDEQRQPFFTMELVQDASTILEAASGQPPAVRVDLLIQMLLALVYLHRRGILHRDLKPANVLVTNGQVKVLDFGLSVHRENSKGIAGTPRYMAPEILKGRGASVESDLYSAGMMAYEMLAGAYPFDTASSKRLAESILHTEPDMGPLAALGGPVPAGAIEKLESVLRRLLAKSPQSRYSNAIEVIHDFSAAIGQPVPPETSAIRESFLQAAEFVGREAELNLLRDALDRAGKGNGSAWLVGGETGVGKSRLLDELRTQALVKGFLVLTGQAVSEGGSAYQEWREPLRRLVLTTELSPPEIAVIATLVPDIGELVDREIVRTPDVEPQQIQDRLVAAVEAVFARQEEPILVILQDLHWMGNESFAILERLSRLASRRNLIIAATYRDDQMPGLPSQYPEMQVLKLQRLRQDAIADLSESMLGPAGRRPEVLEFLQAQTEGNVFFLVEVVRSLSEAAGGLQQALSAAIPSQVVTGGISRFIQSRLDRVRPEDWPLLEASAIAGRQLNLDILRILHPDRDLAGWLRDCSEYAILDLEDDKWRFAHDKLRETVLALLPEEKTRRLHAGVAEAIETFYPDGARPTAALAHHWGKAGVRDRERHWTVLAGREMLQSGAYSRAIEYFQRALDLLDTLGETERTSQEIAIQLNLGTAFLITRGHASAEMKAAYDRAGELCLKAGDISQLFRVLFGQSTFYLFRGQLDSAREMASRCLDLAHSTGSTDLLLQSQFALGNALYWMGEFNAAEEQVQRILAIYEPEHHQRHTLQFGHNPRITCLTFGAWTAWARGYPDMALDRGREALELARQVSHDFSGAIAIQILAFVHQSRGEVAPAKHWAEELIRIAAEFPTYRIAGKIIRGWALLEQGNVEEGIAEIEEGWAIWRAMGAGLAQSYYSTLLGEAYWKAGKLRQGLVLLEDALPLARRGRELCYESELCRLRGELLLALDPRNVGAAEESFLEALAIAGRQDAKSFQLRAAMSLASLRLDPGKHARSAATLRGIFGSFTEGFETLDLKKAKSMLENMQ